MAKTRYEYYKEYIQRHPDRVKESQRKWWDNNRERKREYSRQFRKDNRERMNEYNRMYYAKTEDAINKNMLWTQEEIEAILAHEVSDTELSAQLGRSVKSIQVKRSKLKAEGEKGYDE